MLKTPPFHHHKVTLTTFTTTTFQCINQTPVPQPVFSQSLLQLQPGAIDCWKSRCSKLPGRSQISTSEIRRRNQYHSPGDQNVVPGQKANHWVWMISRPKKKITINWRIIILLRRRDVPSTRPVSSNLHAIEGWSLLSAKDDNRYRRGW